MACPVKSIKDTPTAKQRYELAKLTESLNKQGKKLLELKATLFKEASLTQTSFDERLFDPLVLRYQYDIGTADAMRAYLSDTTKELEFVRSNAEKYHFFLECLQNSFVRPESMSTSGSSIRDPNVAIPGKPPRVEVMSETSADHAQGHASIGIDKMDDFNIHQKVAELNVEHVEPSSVASKKNNEDQLSNRDDLSRDDWSNKGTIYPKAILTNDTDTVDDISEMEFDVAEKYKVFRPKKIRDRKRIFDLFPDPIPPTLPVPKFQSTPLAISFSPEKTIGKAQNFHTKESHSGNAGLDESIHLNKSKSANESWYEYKERCSVTSLPDNVQHSDSQKPLSPFNLRDYMKTPPYMVTSPTKSIKIVRFSLSPSQSQRQRTSSSRVRNKYPSDTSSDDDEVGFVQQFPCVEKPARPRSKERRQLHFY